MSRASAIALCALLAGCAASAPQGLNVCRLDAECGAGQICFPEGCGDPGGGLVVEVEGNTRTGQLAQDFAIPDEAFSPRINFDMLPPTLLSGEFQRELSMSGLTSYADAVSVRLKGESALIPGVVRNYQATFQKPERGAFSLPVGAGNYVVTAETAEPSIPPKVAEVSVTPGSSTPLTFEFASTSDTIVVGGRLLKRIEEGPVPLDIPVTQPMEVQAFDPVTLRALSQRRPVTSQGDFELFIAPEAAMLESFVVVASPRDAGSMVPSKTFPLTWPVSPALRLVLGDFGDPLPQMRGELLTTSGMPVAGASVYFEGPVSGGGVFRSRVATTDADGVFRVDLLPSAIEGGYVLTALPLPNSAAGVLQRQVKAILKAGTLAVLEPSTVNCPDKITVVGSLTRPGGSSAAVGATVIARAVEQLKELGTQPLPMGHSEVVTDESGRFKIELDPGIYQIDFIPGEDLPRSTRVVTVRAETMALGADGGMLSEAIDLKEYELRKGRKVTGTVTAPTANGVLPAVNATVRYFRVSGVGGVSTSLLLGEAVTDSSGNYSVMLPAK